MRHAEMGREESPQSDEFQLFVWRKRRTRNSRCSFSCNKMNRFFIRIKWNIMHRLTTDIPRHSARRAVNLPLVGDLSRAQVNDAEKDQCKCSSNGQLQFGTVVLFAVRSSPFHSTLAEMKNYLFDGRRLAIEINGNIHRDQRISLIVNKFTRIRAHKNDRRQL